MTDNIKIIPFQVEHLDLLDWREEEKKMYNIGSDFTRIIIPSLEKGMAFSGLFDGRLLAMGGIVPQSQKTGYGWTIFSKWSEKYPRTAARIVKRMLNTMMDDMGIHRLVTYNLLEAEVHHVWCRWLGFEMECICRKFDDDCRDYVQYALVR